ncbi:MAG TPA: CmpA/NrtA family ABC transporter substrate-binding protein [Burkholderiales bacterium]|nr:CmpA/NrtA family ABC transporter substrate-binding protein [Burkholderiales bacterium]
MSTRNGSGPATAADPSRRRFLCGSGAAAATAIAPGMAAGREARIAGIGAPEKTELRVGFMPLTDCASIVMASIQGFDRKHGIKITPVKESSWAAIRDKLITGELDAAHALYGLVYGVQTGIGGLRRDMAVLMTLNRNGQGITLSRRLGEAGVTDGAALGRLLRDRGREYVFAQTFPTGTHAMWLNYWLAAHGIDPLRDVRTVTIPPAQMGEAMQAGRIDGCCVGEPWNAKAVLDGTGFTVATSQQIWPDHPEKVLGATAEFVERNPNCARALVAAVLDASRFVDAAENRAAVARTLADSAFVGAELAAIEGRLLGRYEDGRGGAWQDPGAVRFFGGGEVTFPWLSDGMWFLTQHRRWGLLRSEPDYLAVAARVNRVDVYREAAAQAGVPLPAQPMRSSTLIGGVVWDGRAPGRHAAAFADRRPPAG